jgi:alanine dehydrogenase
MGATLLLPGDPRQGRYPLNTATLLLTRRDVARVLDLATCIEAVEAAFAAHGSARAPAPLIAGMHFPAGGFHFKAAALESGGGNFAAKVNANFPGNPAAGLPTIHGAILLYETTNGRLLAVMDSAEITALRTAAATAVAARRLARADAGVVTLCGCGVQGRAQLRALALIRKLREVYAFDSDQERAVAFCTEMQGELGIPVSTVAAPRDGALRSDIVVTCTPSTAWFLGRGDVRAGAFVAAVGADAEHKQEIEPALLAAATLVVDVLDQAATIGDLHHALEAGIMTRAGVHAELGEIVAGTKPGRRSAGEVIVFDSTGTALQDVAAAAVACSRARERGVGLELDLGS